jgi:alpha-N-arabinofuranosidase
MANMTVLQSTNLDAVNSLDNPTNISPKESQVPVSGKALNIPLAPYSFSVVRVKI